MKGSVPHFTDPSNGVCLMHGNNAVLDLNQQQREQLEAQQMKTLIATKKTQRKHEIDEDEEEDISFWTD